MSQTKTDLSPFCRRARYLLSKGLKEDAIDLYSDVISVDADNAMAYAERGTVYAMLKMFEQALRDIKKALELGYRDAALYTTAGSIHFEQKQYERSLEFFGKSIALQTNNPLAFYNRSNAYFSIGQPQAAIRDLEVCMTFNIDNGMRKLINERIQHILSKKTA